MGVINYSNLQKQAAGAAETQELKKIPMPEGLYLCAFRGGNNKPSKAGNDKFAWDWRIKCEQSKKMHRLEFTTHFTMTKECKHQVDEFLALAQEANVDFSPISDDEDWLPVFDQMEENRVRAVVEFYYKAKDKDDNGKPKKGARIEKQIMYLLTDVNGEKLREIPEVHGPYLSEEEAEEAEGSADSDAKDAKDAKAEEKAEAEKKAKAEKAAKAKKAKEAKAAKAKKAKEDKEKAEKEAADALAAEAGDDAPDDEPSDDTDTEDATPDDDGDDW